jgi:hypothetical protein
MSPGLARLWERAFGRPLTLTDVQIVPRHTASGRRT